MNLSTSFKKDIAGLDQKVKGRVLEALLKLAAAPTTPNGDTVKPLAGDSKGLWRIRIGDYRLIYLPTTPPPVVCLLTPASFVDFEQGIARTHNCAGERPRRSHVIS
jgi:mRNA-degrading endonuclease RelE of RelBE toxin-antitoxin system